MLELLLENMPLAMTAAGLVLMALEALSPGAHLIVIGVALIGAGVVGLLFPPVASPFILAALTLGIGLAATYVYREFDFYGGKSAGQTPDSRSLSGKTGYVTKTVSTREGEVKLDNGGFAPYYSARTSSGTIEEGEEIIVLDPGGGNVLTVESTSGFEADEIDRALARGVVTEELEREMATEDPDNADLAGSDTGDTDTESESESESETQRDDAEPATETEKQ